jgi:hypothetical protein
VLNEEPVQMVPGQTRGVGDFFSVVGIVAFAAAMLGLIWALERV